MGEGYNEREGLKRGKPIQKDLWDFANPKGLEGWAR